MSFVKPLYSKKDPMHGFSHILRIKRKVSLFKKGYRELDRDLILFLIYFHGIKKWVKDNKKKVIMLGFKEEHIKSLTRADDAPRRNEEKIVCDANAIENVGRFGIHKSNVLAKYYQQTLEETTNLQRGFIGEYKFYTPLGKKLGAKGIAIKGEWLKRQMGKLAKIRSR